MATETAIDVVMPQMGVSVSEGTITRWLKQEGEHVEADEPLLEISTDKVDTEVPSPASGTVTQILVQEGETVDVGTKLAQIGGAAAGDAPAPEAPPAAEPAAAAPAPAAAMRRGIAEHMRRSLDTAAHVTSAIEVDLSRIVDAREQLKKEYQAAYGVNPTYLAFIARATVQTLPNHPYVNGELRGESIITRNFGKPGIAVNLADRQRLHVTVLKNAETMNLLGLAKGIADIAKRAREKQ